VGTRELSLQRDRLTRLLAEIEQKKGPIEPEVMEEVRRAWPSPEETKPF
jgi:hypothetical protein